MPTPRFYRTLTLVLLLALSVSCVAQPAPSPALSPVEGLPAVLETDSPPTPLPAAQPSATDAPSQPTKPAKATTSKPTRAPKATNPPANNQGGGSTATQGLSFDLPARPYEVILGRPTANSITLSLLSATAQTLSIAYGIENAAPQTISAALAANTPQEITLPNLTPDTAYFYTVNGGEKHPFHTARASGDTFTFDIQADSHLDSNSSLPVYLQTLANQRADQPDFVIDLGDTFMTDKYKPDYTASEPQYWAQRYYFSLLDAPLFLVLGNHDGEGAPKGQSNDMSTWSAQLRTKLFPNPAPDGFYTGSASSLQDYYAWTWGDALFVVLDPYWFTPATQGNTTDLWNPTLGAEQYQWLKSTLEGSSAKWKFVFIHQLIGGYDKNGRGGVEVASFYEWGGKNADGSDGFAANRPGWAMPIHQLLLTNHVTAVFHGHDHLFVHQELDGITYQEVPQPSASHANGTNSAAEYGYLSGDILGSPGHLRVTVKPDGVTVDYVRAYLPQDENASQKNGQVSYTYTIHPR